MFRRIFFFAAVVFVLLALGLPGYSHREWAAADPVVQSEEPAPGSSYVEPATRFHETSTERSLVVRTSGARTVRPGELFEYDLQVSNPSTTLMREIVVTDQISPLIQLDRATPNWTYLDRRELEGAPVSVPPAFSAGPGETRIRSLQTGPYVRTDVPTMAHRAHWFFAELEPGRILTIHVYGRGAQDGTWVASATAAYDQGPITATSPPPREIEVVATPAPVVAPNLRLTARIDREFSLCNNDSTDLILEATYRGKLALRDVSVTVDLPEGLTAGDSRTYTVKLNRINPNEKKRITLPLHVERPGEYEISAMAVGKGFRVSAVPVSMTARRPELFVETAGPAQGYLGAPLDYEVRVKNIGNATAQDVLVQNRIPSGVRFVGASERGENRNDAVYWRIPELAPGKETGFMTHLESTKGTGAATIRNIVIVTSRCTEKQTAVTQTRLEGVPAMRVEVVDLQDPITVGETETYIIQVTNQGSAPETNVVVSYQLEPAVSLESAEGETPSLEILGNSRRFTFERMASLAPRETATWRVRVRGVHPGDVRFSVEVQSADHDRPILETEATRVIDATPGPTGISAGTK